MVVADLGDASAAAAGAPSDAHGDRRVLRARAAASRGPGSSRHVRRARRWRRRRRPRTAPARAPTRRSLGGARQALDAQELAVDLRVPLGTVPPRCPPGDAAAGARGHCSRARAVCLPRLRSSSCAASASPSSSGRDGEVKRDFLMLALAHTGNLSAEDQQRIIQGADPGPLGQATRLVREMGGFVRFAPLPGGALETRVFLPAA